MESEGVWSVTGGVSVRRIVRPSRGGVRLEPGRLAEVVVTPTPELVWSVVSAGCTGPQGL